MYYDLLLHVDSYDRQVLNLAFTNAVNYQAALAGEEYRMVLVANGPAVKLFTKRHVKLAERGATLLASGLNIWLCNNALQKSEINTENLWPGCQIVPAGLVEIVKLQREGFAYIKP